MHFFSIKKKITAGIIFENKKSIKKKQKK